MTCKLVKQVSKKCAGVVPISFGFNSFGPNLATRSYYYYFDGAIGSDWPTHDPCGANKQNQLTGVVNPHGNIFVR